MIEAVILKISPDMLEALQSVADRDQQIENWLHVNGESIGQGGPAVVSRYGAELMVQSWFSGDDIRTYIRTDGRMFPTNKLRTDPLIRDFQDTVLKIYRLTASV